MSRIAALAAVALAPVALGQAGVYTNTYGVYTVTQDTGGDIPLASKHFTWPDLPYQADTGNGPRGTQQGYNLCNATTQNQQSMCQTGYVNSIDDFCIWGAATDNEVVANVEGEMVAYCTKKKYGTRLIPQGALTGVQFIRTPDYVEVVGFIDQTTLDLQANDTGGEEDPHGADQRGNPLGSLLYSNAFNNSLGAQYTQVTEWSYFIGSGVFCFKACDPNGSRAAQLCQHTYDRVGCAYNDPASYPTINNTFASCQGDDQLPVGQYVVNGATSTWVQPPESLGAITSIPYTASIPPTSACTTYTSSSIYTELAPASTTAASSAKPTSSGAKASGSASGAAATGTSGSSSGSSSSTSGASVDAGSKIQLVVSLGLAGLVSLGMALMA